jgi:signal transduction histidine kinase
METRRLFAGLPRADVALALGLFALTEAFVVTGTLMSGGATPLSVASAAALTLPLAWRRRAPLAAAAIIAGAIVVDDLVAGWDNAVISFPFSIIAAYSAGAHARQRHAVAALTALAVANLIDALGAPGNRAGDLALGLVVFSLVPWLAGQALRRERARTAELQELATQLAAEREERTREAVSAERGRIARELHDIVGHAISLIAVQADAAGKLLSRDPSRAQAPLETIQTTSRGALAEMRQLVGLLRDGDEEPLLEPQPGVANLDRLVGDARRAGLRVELELTGEPVSLPPTLDLAAYRIVQEGLTNVRKHAGDARTSVSVHYGENHLDVEVRNGGEIAIASGGGHGLIGIRERVTLLGGDLESGPAENGGFVLRARLPLAGDSR